MSSPLLLPQLAKAFAHLLASRKLWCKQTRWNAFNSSLGCSMNYLKITGNVFQMHLSIVPQHPNNSFESLCIYDFEVVKWQTGTHVAGSFSTYFGFNQDNNTRLIGTDVLHEMVSEGGAASTMHIPHQNAHRRGVMMKSWSGQIDVPPMNSSTCPH